MKSDHPFLTIGIASYNYAGYLEKAFSQIKKQRFSNFELLYCDDGSTDESIAVIEKLIRENPDMNIRLMKSENRGLLANKNRIIKHAKGEYLLICDADDYMADDCLERLCRAAQEENADCVIGGFCEADESGKVHKVHIPTTDANKWIYIWHHAQIYKTELVRTYHLKFEEIPDDVCFLQWIHLYGKKTVFVSENLYYWIRHLDSTSWNFDTKGEWHPTRLWHNIVGCMMNIGEKITDEEEQWQIRYFLYKWFYFNMADQPIANKAEWKLNLKCLQEDMKRICPEYRRISFLRKALRQKDTFYARMAVLICWVMEGIGSSKLLPMLREKQQKMYG